MRNPTALFETSLGHFMAELYLDKMPLTAGNFVRLAQDNFFDGLHFHRVIKRFMVQTGCPFSRDPFDRRAGTGDPDSGCIRDEFTARLSNLTGTLAMANDGRPHSGGSQFFVNCVDNPQLDWWTPGGKHPVFGRVVQGLEVIRVIETVPTDRGERPVEPVLLERVTIG
jgi:peptidylprolyl isomerase